MESNTVVLHPTDKIGKAAEELSAHRFRSLPVVELTIVNNEQDDAGKTGLLLPPIGRYSLPNC
jgi:CBS domain-containing protein